VKVLFDRVASLIENDQVLYVFHLIQNFNEAEKVVFRFRRSYRSWQDRCEICQLCRAQLAIGFKHENVQVYNNLIQLFLSICGSRTLSIS